MKIETIRGMKAAGYFWVLGDGHATLKRGEKPIIRRKISDKFFKFAMLTSIDFLCFSIFGVNGRDRAAAKRLEEI